MMEINEIVEACYECLQNEDIDCEDAFGDDNLLTTTDYPHADSKFPHATDTFLGLPMPDASKKKILWDNPTRLYSL